MIKYRALLIGVSTYRADPKNLPSLRGPLNDVAAMHAAITHPERGLFTPEDVTALYDPTKQELLECVHEFYSSSNNEQQLLFYYSGHGERDIHGDFYLCTTNTKCSALVATAVSDLDINKIIAASGVGRTLIIVDACYSGAFDVTYKSGSLAPPRSLLGNGRFVLSSSLGHQKTADAPNSSALSPFTKCLTDSITGGISATKHPSWVTVNEVYDCIYPELAKINQTPTRYFDRTLVDMVIARTQPASLITRHPVLATSIRKILVTDVEEGDDLPAEIIYVYEESGGSVSWDATATGDWLTIGVTPSAVMVTFNKPKVGRNRGIIFIRNSQGIDVVRVPVEVFVSPPGFRAHMLAGAAMNRRSEPTIRGWTVTSSLSTPLEELSTLRYRPKILTSGPSRPTATDQPAKPVPPNKSSNDRKSPPSREAGSPATLVLTRREKLVGATVCILMLAVAAMWIWLEVDTANLAQKRASTRLTFGPTSPAPSTETGPARSKETGSARTKETDSARTKETGSARSTASVVAMVKLEMCGATAGFVPRSVYPMLRGSCVDIAPVSLASYSDCVDSSICKPADSMCDISSTFACTDWISAFNYCAQWLGRRMIAIDEWNALARSAAAQKPVAEEWTSSLGDFAERVVVSVTGVERRVVIGSTSDGGLGFRCAWDPGHMIVHPIASLPNNMLRKVTPTSSEKAEERPVDFFRILNDGYPDVDCLLKPNLRKCLRENIRLGVADVRHAVKACGLEHGALPDTTVGVRLAIRGSTGKVISARPVDDHASTHLGSCVAGAAAEATFAIFEVDRPVVQFQFNFRM